MNEIYSKDSKRIKILKKLGTKKYRNKLGQFVVENIAIIYDALKSGYKIESLYLTDAIMDSKFDKVQAIIESVEADNVFIINEAVNKQFSSLETPSGIAGVYNKHSNKISVGGKKILYLNEIKDPGNLGTILRSAVAFGVSDIVLDERCVDLYNPKVVQSAKDAIFKTNVVFDKNREILEEIKSKMDIFVTDVDGGVEVKDAFKSKDSFCVVMGNESHGVSEEVKEMASTLINIKSSPEMESLNVAVSTGIILYEMYNCS